ncbi:hypothetical protein L195_g000451 [Trifolium pratense]|uniref:Uncharacterized protein n=1 Tax=Trifolium pratense TaxID=57577 RepID=A0A2K3NM05_TRIPR|nr:hypothetical protein L195_g000451 [Trifolium pratense]
MTTRVTIETPVDATMKLGNLYDGTQVDKGMYHRLVEKLICLSHTRPAKSPTSSISKCSMWYLSPIGLVYWVGLFSCA